MKTFFCLLSLACLAAAMPSYRPQRTADDLTAEEIALLADLAQSLQRYEAETRNVTEQPTDLRTGKACITESDCEEWEFCADAPDYVRLITEEYHHEYEIARINTKANIRGRECSITPHNFMKRVNTENVVKLFNESVNEIHSIMDAFQIKTELPVVMEVKFTDITEPVLRQSAQTAFSDFNNIFLLLALRGDSGTTDDRTNLLILLSLFSQQQQVVGGTGSLNFLSNPFLLYSLLGSGTSGISSDILLYSFLLNPTGITATPTTSSDLPVATNFFSNPLILYSLLQNSGTSDNNNLLLLIFLSGGLGGGVGGPIGGAGDLQSILPLLLLGNGTLGGSGDLSSLLPILLLGGGGLGGVGGVPGQAGGLNQLLPLLLIQPDLLGGSGSNDNLLLLLALSGGLTGGAGTGVGGPYGSGLESILPLLLLTNSSLGSGSSDLSSLLPLLLLGGGGLGGVGGVGGQPGLSNINQLLPLLLLGNSTLGGTGDNNLLLLLLLSQGATGVPGASGGLESILPLLLLSNSTLGGGSLTDSLPLLLLLGGGLGTQTDPATGLPIQSPISNLLPLLLLNQSGSSDNLLLMFILLFSQQVSPATVYG